jgi:hypothetical protein
MNRTTLKPGEVKPVKLDFKFVAPCVSLSFLVAVGPAYADRADRIDAGFDRSVLRQMRLEQRQSRIELRQNDRVSRQAVLSIQAPIITPQVSNDASLRVRANHVRNLDTTALRRENRTWQQVDNGRVRSTNGSVELNLGSGERSIILGSDLFAQSSITAVTLTVGGGEQNFAVGSKVTAAEYASILQLLGGGSQSLQLDGQGRAAGGSMALESLTNGDRMRVSSFVVPEAVKVVGNFSNRSDFNLTGDLVNNGSIIALSNREGANRASISAHNLTNGSAGLISTIVDPSAFPQYENLQSTVDLRLRADETLLNQGSITSSGNLTLSAKVVSNESPGRTTAILSAQNNLSIEANQLSNSGSIAAQQGNITVLAANGLAGPIKIDNAGGRIAALNGSINIGDASSLEKYDTTITGGDFLSKTFIANSGDGNLEVDVNSLTGAVSAKAGTAHFAANSDLFIENLQTSGDPTIKSTGNLVVGNVDTDGGPLALLARGDISFVANAVIDTSSTTGAGGAITAVAGSNWAAVGANNSITGASSGGGSIIGTGNAITFETDGLTDAGAINLIAFTSASNTKGSILLDSASISAQGGVGGNNGNVTIIGGGEVLLVGVDARGSGSKAGTGNVLISAFKPAIVNGPVLIDDASGAIVQGSFASGGFPADTINLTVSGAIEAGGNVNVQGSDAITVGSIIGQSLSLTASTDIQLKGDLTAPGGIAIVAGHNITLAGGAVSDFSTASSTTNGGDVTIVAGANFTETASTIQITGGSGTGGFIDFSFDGKLGVLDTRSSATNGSGGDVTLIAYTGADLNGLVYTDFNNTKIRTGGSGTGSNGNFTAIAGNNTDSNGIGIRGSVDTSGGSAVGTGNAFVATATPNSGVTIAKATGAITAGDFKGGAITNSAGFVDDITVGNGAAITITSGRFLQLTTYSGGVGSSLNVSAANSAIGSVDFQSLKGIHVGTTSVVGGGFISLAGDLISPGGVSLISGSDIVNVVFNTTLSTASATGDAGDITLVAGAAFTQTANSVTITGASATGGQVNFDATNLNALNASSSFAGGTAGNITVAAFNGSKNTGQIFFDLDTAITANGTGIGENGIITFVAGATTGVAIQAPTTISMVGGKAGSGAVYMEAATPAASLIAPVVVSRLTGGLTSGDFRGGKLNKADITVGNTGKSDITIRGGVISLLSDGNVFAGNLDVSAAAVGNGGAIFVTSGSNETLDIGALTGSNTIGSVLANGGTTSGNAGSAAIISNGTGGLNLQTFDPFTVTEGNGGFYLLSAPNGTLTVSSAVDLNVNAATASAANRAGGSATIIAGNVTTVPSAVIPISGSGTGSGANGFLSITLNGQALALGTANNQFDIGSFETVNLKTNNSFGITVNAGGGYSATNSTIDTAGALVITAPITASGTLTLLAGAGVVNSTTITGTSALNIFTTSLANTGTINGGVITFEGNSFAMSGAGGQVNATTSTTINANAGNVSLSGSQTFSGPLTINAFAVPGAMVTVQAGANYTGLGPVTVNTYTYTENGTLTGNPKTINSTFYNIVNDNGNVVLTSSLNGVNYTGKNLAIIASGNVFASGATEVDLSSVVGPGGSLLILAGYNFTPSLTGQQANGTLLTVTGPSTTGGSIDLANVTIDLSSTNGNAGSLTAVASKGTVNVGSVKLGDIDTTATAGNGGAAQIIGQGGIQVGTISTQGSGTDGDVSIASSNATITGTISVENGTQQPGGTIQSTGIPLAGDIAIKGINAPDADVTLIGAQAVSNTISQAAATSINTQTLTVVTGDGTANLSGLISTLVASGSGDITLLQGNKDVTLASATGPSLNLTLIAGGKVFVDSGSVTGVDNLNLTATAGAGINGIILGGSIGVTSDLSLTVNGGGNLLANQNLTAGDDILLTATTGDLSVSSVLSGQDVGLAAGNNLTVSGTITSPNSVSLSSGDALLLSDISGSIGTTKLLLLNSDAGTVGTLANPFSTDALEIQVTAGNSAFVQSTRTAGVLLSAGAAGGQFQFAAAGQITIGGDITTISKVSGEISINQNGKGALTINSGVNINSTEGDVVLNNNDIDKKTGSIKIGNNVNIKGSGTTTGVGEVYIVLGGIPAVPVTRRAPKNVIVNQNAGGTVFLGRKGISVKRQTSIVLQALGRNLVFNTGTRQSSRAISLGSNVNITADPPGDVFTASERSQRVSTQLNQFPSEMVSSSSASGAVNAASLETSVARLGTPLNRNQSAVLLTETVSATAVDALSAAQLSNAKYISNQFSQMAAEELISDYLPAGLLQGNASSTYETSSVASSTSRNVSVQSNNALSGTVSVEAKGTLSPSSSLKQFSQSSGMAMYAPSENIIVNTPSAQVAIKRDSLVMVVAGAHGTSVYDLHDSSREAVILKFNNQSIALTPGRHATVCANRADSFGSVNPIESIPHRGLNRTNANGSSAFTSEFAIHSSFESLASLRSIAQSNHPQCKKLTGKVMKTAAVLMHLSNGQDGFERHLRPQMTACIR